MTTINSRILGLALPMALTQLITTASGFLCMTMLASLGQDVLAASALIFAISISLVVLGISFLFSLSVLISQAYGARDYFGIGSLYQQGLLFALLLSLPLMLVYWNIGSILRVCGQDELLIPLVQDFFHANIWRVIPLMLSVCNQQLCYGVHKQRIDLFANILGVVVLLLSAYVFIYGKFGFPALGVAGFGYANDLQALTYLLISSLFILIVPDFKRYQLFKWRILQQWSLLKKIISTAWPIALHTNGEILSFMVSVAIVGWLGSKELAAYQIILQYQFLVVIPLFAIAQASGVLIGQAYGAKTYADIPKLGKGSLRLALWICLACALVFIAFPHFLASFYLKPEDASSAEIMQLSSILFVFMAISQFFDAIRNVLTGSLRDILDNKYPMMIGLATIWLVYIPLSYLLALPLHFGIIGLFAAWLFALILGALLMWRRFKQQSARYQAVIE